VYSRAADTRSEDHPARQAPRYRGRLIAGISGKSSQFRVLHSRAPGEDRTLGADNDRPSFVTTDRYENAAYHASTEPAMSPEIPVMARKNWQGLSMRDRKIFDDGASHRAVE
jgi:hypothetical protein